jgi:hypothetical protein
LAGVAPDYAVRGVIVEPSLRGSTQSTLKRKTPNGEALENASPFF